MPDDIFATPGRLGALMAAHDWASSPVGPVNRWPQSLRAGVRLILRSRYPMILTWGPEYTQFYNDAYAQLIGERHPAALGGDIRETLAEGWDVLGPLIEEAMSTGIATWVPALRLLMARAGYREEAYFDVSHAPMADDDGRVVGMFAVCTEVTDQVVGERRLRLLRDLSAGASEARDVQAAARGALGVLGEHPLDVPFAALYFRDGDVLRRAGVVGIDGGLPAEVALAEQDSWGIAAAAGGATTVIDTVAERAEVEGGPWADRVRSALSSPIAGGALVTGVTPSRALDGPHRDFFTLLVGQVSSAVRAARAREEERRRAEALAELDRAKTDFFANVSHEFRTPLTLLLGPLDDALADAEGPLAPAQRQRVELAARNARRMLKLVNGLLDFSRLQAGAWQASLRRLDLAQATADQAAVFRSAIERAGLRFTVDCPPVGDDIAVDPDGWEQIVLNLVSNAFKYTFTGEIRVTLRRQGDEVTLTVADTGVGIAPDELPRLFERFHRVSGAQARTHEGTGVGLALVRDFAEVHGGRAQVESTLGAGSTFTVTIPAGGRDAPVAETAGPSARAAMSVEEALGWEAAPAPAVTGAAASGPSVLLVDDNADMRAYAERILRDHCRVRTAPDGLAALEAVHADPPDLVVSDVMMPRLDGFELLQALRADPATASIPVVLLSARSGPEAAVEGLRRGADDYLVKPFAAQELLARVLANAGRGRRHGADAAAAPVPALRLPAPDETPVDGIDAIRDSGVLRLRMPARPAALRHLRHALRGFLAERGVDRDETDGLLVAVCEAATNAIEHADDPVAAVVEVRAWADGGRMRVDVRDFGRWRPRGPSMDRGRGSALMEAYADVRVTPSPEGTLVSLTSKPAG